MPDPQTDPAPAPPPPTKLWLYTNFDCNLRCMYCVAESTPTAPRRALGLDNVRRLVDEAVDLGFEDVFFTGGEPFLLDDIYDMLAYAAARLPATVLTNSMLFNEKRLDKLAAINNDNLRVQVSLDGGRAEHHDPVRGAGSWAKTVAGIRKLVERDFQMRISATETAANCDRLHELRAFVHSLGIPDENLIIRPLARRGFSDEGMDVSIDTLVPELTVIRDGIFWHPLISPAADDMRVTTDISSLAAALDLIEKRLETGMNGERACFT